MIKKYVLNAIGRIVIDMTDSTIQEIRKVKERVVYLYNHFGQELIDSDRKLIDRYLRTFYGCHDNMFYDQLIDRLMANKVSFETIRRTAQKLRELYPERFNRSEEVKDFTIERECSFKSEMLKGSQIGDW